MKAAQHTSYNKNNIALNLTDIAKPNIKPDQVLVKVTAAGVNPLDNMISRGEVKLIVPYKLPQTAGNEIVGLVTEVGSSVTKFEVGDRVFGRLPPRQHRCLCRVCGGRGCCPCQSSCLSDRCGSGWLPFP